MLLQSPPFKLNVVVIKAFYVVVIIHCLYGRFVAGISVMCFIYFTATDWSISAHGNNKLPLEYGIAGPYGLLISTTD